MVGYTLNGSIIVGWVEVRRPEGASRRVTQQKPTCCWVSLRSTQPTKG